MKLIIEDEGISLLENKGQYYLQYDAGAHMIKKKRIEITNEEAELCQLDVEEMYNLILQYQNDGVYGEDVVEYMSLYTADGFTGTPIACDEGELEWVEKSKIGELELWEGDRIFFELLENEQPFFSLKLVYNTDDVLEYAALDGKEMKDFRRREC